MHLLPCLKYSFSKGLFVTPQAWSSEWSTPPRWQRRWPRSWKQKQKNLPRIGREHGRTLFWSHKLMVCIMKDTDHMKLRAALPKGFERIPDALSSLTTETPTSGFSRETTEVWVTFGHRFSAVLHISWIYNHFPQLYHVPSLFFK